MGGNPCHVFVEDGLKFGEWLYFSHNSLLKKLIMNEVNVILFVLCGNYIMAEDLQGDGGDWPRAIIIFGIGCNKMSFLSFERIVCITVIITDEKSHWQWHRVFPFPVTHRIG